MALSQVDLFEFAERISADYSCTLFQLAPAVWLIAEEPTFALVVEKLDNNLFIAGFYQFDSHKADLAIRATNNLTLPVWLDRLEEKILLTRYSSNP
jgi:hypothetical protein